MKKKKLLCIITAVVVIITGASASVSCAADNITKQDISSEVITIDLSKLSIDKEAVSKWNSGLIDALRAECSNNSLTVDDLKGKPTRFDRVLYEYGQENCDEISAIINNQLMEKTHSKKVILDLNIKSPAYKQYVRKYRIDKNTEVTITPESIYIDECAEEVVSSTKPDKGTVANADGAWKYKKVAARRTLFYKRTVNGKTYSFDIFSAHTGGQVKYNGSSAKHSGDYYGHSMRRTYGELATFTKIVKLNEQYSGTSWQYKYVGKVSGTMSITNPISLKISLPDKLLGCQVIISKTGKVTKKYWPAL